MKFLVLCIFSALFSCTQKKEVTLNPSDYIQKIINNQSAKGVKKFIFNPGVYRPHKKGQALIYLNKNHEGVQLIAKGNVILTSQNENISSIENNPFHPDITSHIVYFGQGISNKTTLDGFTLQGSKGFATKEGAQQAEPGSYWKKSFIYYADGGAIKIWGNSSPTLKNLTIKNNYALLCGAGISIEQYGQSESPVIIENSKFIGNQVNLTGAAIDLLPGSKAVITNSHFEKNSTKTFLDYFPNQIKKEFSNKKSVVHTHILKEKGIFNDSATITLFKGSSLEISKSSFKDNNRSVDYISNIKWYTERIKSKRIKKDIKKSLTNITVRNSKFHTKKKSTISSQLKLHGYGTLENNTFIIEK